MNSLFQLRKFSPIVQLVFLLLFFFIGAVLQSLVLVLAKVDALKPASSAGSVFAIMLSTQFCLFIIPAIAFIKLLPENILKFALSKPLKSSAISISLLTVLAFASIFLVSSLAQFILTLPLGSIADKMQAERKGLEDAALQMSSWTQISSRLLIMAVIPAIGEELFFRGILQRLVQGLVKNPIVAILITAFTFAAFHGSVYNLLPVAIGGIILGLVYYYTRNIWYNIILHFLINGIQVLIMFFQKGASEEELSMPMAALLLVGALGLVIFVLQIFRKHNKTAQQDNWLIPSEVETKY